jgi:hypothetical protein
MKKYNAIQATKAARRKKAMEEGMYDGRFRSKVIVDKRKESSKKKCRKLVLIPNAD